MTVTNSPVTSIAEKNLRVAAAISKQNGDTKSEANALNTIGLILKRYNNIDSAITYLEMARLAFKSVPDITGEARTVNNIGQIYLAQNDFQKAKEYFNKAVALHEASGSKSGLSRAYVNLVTYYDAIVDLGNAQKYGEKAYDIARENDLYVDEAYALGALGKLFYEHKLYDKSIKYYERAVKIAREKQLNDTYFMQKRRISLLHLRKQG